MSFGLKNTGVTYQRAIQMCLDQQIGRNVEAYCLDQNLGEECGNSKASKIVPIKESIA